MIFSMILSGIEEEEALLSPSEDNLTNMEIKKEDAR
jgi:hypothetical protein